MGSPNLFARLHKWATRQDENFLTESLAVVLEHLLILAPEVGTRLVSRLTSGFIDVPANAASTIDIRPQLETGKGRPDLEIRVPHRTTWIEVKVESELRTGQLEGYRVLLAMLGVSATQLVLLTRYPEEFSEQDALPDVQFRWFELAHWIEAELPALQKAGEVAVFLAQQFLNFLRIRGMTLTQVSHTMPEGVRALGNLLNMLVEAASACKVSVKKSTSWDYMGITLDGKYWLGVWLTDPEKLWFQTICEIEPEAAAKLNVGELSQENWGGSWWRGVELNSEEAHFFSRTKVSQMVWLEKFLMESLVMAKAIETPNQPPVTEQPQED